MMSNKLLFLLSVLLSCVNTFAQIKVYKCSEFSPCENSVNQFMSADEAILCLAMLDNQYDLTLTTISHGVIDDNISVLMISYGSYLEYEEQIVLYDSIFGFEMDFSIDTNGVLVANHCLNLVKGKVLVYDSVTSRNKLFPRADVGNWKDAYIKPTSRPFELISGKYMARLVGRHELNLNDEGDYDYIIDGFMISKGEWHREDNVLVLEDEAMGTPIQTLVVSDNTLSKYLPGNFRVSLFRFSFDEAERYKSSKKTQ